MFITGPAVIKSVTGEEVTAEDLGGAMAHNSVSGAIIAPPNIIWRCYNGNSAGKNRVIARKTS
uniref:carboxyl transferase domain-containing protein n=1 Tax=Veillonella sp. TaxID=1926307 RepID=UPI0035A06515